MIDTDKYIEDVDEKYNLIMNLMNDEEREFEIKTRIRLSNKMKMTIDTLDAEVKRLQLVEMSVQDFLDEKIDSLEFCRNMRDMGVIE